MLYLDYSNLQERRNISKLYMIAGGHWVHVYGLGNECTEGYNKFSQLLVEKRQFLNQNNQWLNNIIYL